MHKLTKALAQNNVIVKNVTSGEISLHYPEIGSNGYPTGVVLQKIIPSEKVVDLTKDITIKALRLSSSLKKLVKARHLLVVL